MFQEQQFPQLWLHIPSMAWLPQRRRIVDENQNDREHQKLGRIVSKQYRTTTAKVTAELNIHLVFTKTVHREVYKPKIHERVASARLLITDTSAKNVKKMVSWSWKPGPQFSTPTSLKQLDDILLDEWYKIPLDIQKLDESIPSRLEAVFNVNGGPTLH